ncbi:unnamed protein product [Lactuca virosa]|uniref:Uncharacterized protein n=1 Tax=Lactuca virosa TaxID=75947 RepID=A0AAU9PTT5_9ASTR|nr:unnamed protein product [Lactuca virosa]
MSFDFFIFGRLNLNCYPTAERRSPTSPSSCCLFFDHIKLRMVFLNLNGKNTWYLGILCLSFLLACDLSQPKSLSKRPGHSVKFVEMYDKESSAYYSTARLWDDGVIMN